MTLDIEQPGSLEAYLRKNNYILPEEPVDTLPLAGGVSNRTVLIRRANGEAWVVKQALEKLRVAVDWFSSPTRIHREALALRIVAQLLPAGTVPLLIFEDWDHHLLGMSAVPEPHVNWKSMLLQGTLQDNHVRQFAILLGKLHGASTEQAGSLAGLFADRTFFETLRLEPYYAYSASQIPEAAPFLTQLIAETDKRRHCIVHGDFSPKNILVHREQLVLLDYEVIHWGDPAFDVGFALTHLLSKAHHLSTMRNDFASAALTYWDTYRTTIGNQPWSADLAPWVVRHTMACLLARVAGRSPLEYLSTAERHRQLQAVLAMLVKQPPTVAMLIEQFIAALA